MIRQETASASLYNRLVDEFESQHHLSAAQTPDRSDQIRTQAFEIFKQKGFPTVRDEEWRFTSLVPYLKGNFSLEPAEVTKEQLQEMIAQSRIAGLDAYLIVLVNGHIHFGLSELPSEDFVVVDSTRDISGNADFTETLYKSMGIGSSLVALNSALFDNGFYLQVKRNAVLDKPLHILHLYTANKETFFQPRHYILVNSGAKAEILETSLVWKDNGSILVNSVTEVVVKSNAWLTQYQLQNQQSGERWLQHSRITQERDSRYDSYTISLPGADLIRNNLDAILDGPNTETHLYGLYLTGGNQLTDNHTLIHHKHPNCQSNEVYKGVLMDASRAVFNGKVFVDPEAQKTNGFQQNNNLLLSDKAQVHAKPQLEIYADDVRCSHGCTVGQFSPESLFYLRSRGIGENEAKKLLVEAFLFDVTDNISNEVIQNHVKQLIYQKLDHTPVILNEQ